VSIHCWAGGRAGLQLVFAPHHVAHIFSLQKDRSMMGRYLPIMDCNHGTLHRVRNRHEQANRRDAWTKSSNGGPPDHSQASRPAQLPPTHNTSWDVQSAVSQRYHHPLPDCNKRSSLRFSQAHAKCTFTSSHPCWVVLLTTMQRHDTAHQAPPHQNLLVVLPAC
jgi:hypothetical protein